MLFLVDLSYLLLCVGAHDCTWSKKILGSWYCAHYPRDISHPRYTRLVLGPVVVQISQSCILLHKYLF